MFTSTRSTVFDFRSRVQQVHTALQLSRTNHIVQATCRAMWAQLYNNGFDVIGKVDPDVLELVYVPYGREAIKSLFAVGYFAFVIDTKTHEPRVLDPASYIVASSEILHFCVDKSKEFNVVFLNQEDCEAYRTNPPELYIQYAPLLNGTLTCPAMSVIDMHDAIIEFTRLALLGDNINVRPKAWLSAKDHQKNPGVYHFLDESATVSDPSKFLHSKNIAQNRNGKQNFADCRNSMSARQTQETKTPGTFTDTCISRQFQIDAVNDPSIRVEVAAGTDITNMGQTHTRSDLVSLIHLFDQRMCNALGIPLELLGLNGANKTTTSRESSELWERMCVPYRNLLNISLAKAVEKTITQTNAKLYKKTRDRMHLLPVRISLNYSVTFDKLLILQPYMTPKGFAKTMALITGLEATDFQQTVETAPKK